MQYGAYRRWKLAEDSLLDSKGKPKKKKSKSSTGYVAGDYKVDGAAGGEAIGSRDVGGKKKNKKGGSLNSDSFYDAIKKFGAGAKVSYGSFIPHTFYSFIASTSCTYSLLALSNQFLSWTSSRFNCRNACSYVARKRNYPPQQQSHLTILKLPHFASQNQGFI